MLIILPTINVTAQNYFTMPSFWEVFEPGLAFNIEAFDINKDGKLDVVTGNWNNTYVYFGGPGTLDETVDVIYTGRMLSICDYNGDGFDDMINMHLTSFDSSRWDYNGEILFYWGSDTTDLSIDTIPDYTIPLPTKYPRIEKFTIGYKTVGIHTGDLNGDGKMDIILSSLNIRDTITTGSNGRIYIYLGKNIPADTVDFKLVGENPSSSIGDFVQVGNINGDDYDDLLFSSRKTTQLGYVHDSLHYLHVYYGSENFSPVYGNEDKIYVSHVNPTDSTAEWFVRSFSVDDINGDGIEDVVVGRSFYNYPMVTNVHYGSADGIDTIPSFSFIQDTTITLFHSAGGITQNVGDYNNDGYADFIIQSGWQIFTLHFGGPFVSNKNKYGVRGYSHANPTFPRKAVNMGIQNNNDNVNDIAVIVEGGTPENYGYILMLYGQDVPVSLRETEQKYLNFNLFQNYPNPFNPSTKINFQIEKAARIKIVVYNILGKEIAVLINEEKRPGKYEIEFNAVEYNLASGVYFYKISTGKNEIVKKMTYLK